MERLRIRRVIPHELDSEDTVRHVREDLIQQIILRATTDMRPGRWYKIKYEESREKAYEDDVELRIELAYDIIPERVVAERVVVFKVPEEVLLPPEKSLWQKLKNCVKYLRHKTGGQPEEGESGMPPKNKKIENPVLYTSDGQKIGNLADFEIESPFYEHGSEIIGKVQHLDPIEGSFEATLTLTGRKVLEQMEYITAIEWATIMGRPRIAHIAKYGKNRRIRKKNADFCVRIFRQFLKGGKGRGYKFY